MKKIMKKTITIFLILLIIFNFISCNYVPVYGAVVDDVIDGLINLLGGVVGIFTWIPRLIAMALGMMVNLLTAQVAYVDQTDKHLTITPLEIFFNKVKLLDINFLDIDVGGNTETIRTAVAKWYYIIRLISIAILLLILIYVGIRMAISSVASEKAMYKKSLLDWTVSLALVFVLQYIIMLTVNANTAIVNALESATKATGVSDAISEIALTSIGISWEATGSTVVYCMIVFQVLVFLVKYLKRMLTIGFLIIISPLISITYSIDKMGDQKAQALNSWLKEFIYNVLIQPFHCIMYIAFVDVAFQLLVVGSGNTTYFENNYLAGAVLAILCLKFIDDGEKIIRKIFGFGQASSLTPLESAAMAGAVVSGGKMAVNAAQNVRKGINMAKQQGASFRNSINNLSDRMKANQRAKNVVNSNSKSKNWNQLSKEQKKAIVDKQLNKVKNERANRESIKNMKKDSTNRRNKKIEEKMRENPELQKVFGKGGFDELKRKVENGTASKKEMDAYKNAYASASKEVPMSKHPGKTIKRAVSKVANSDVGRFVRKTMIPAGIGLALGSMALGGTNALAAVGAGTAAYKGSKTFAQSSTKTMTDEAKNYLNKKVSNEEELREKIIDIKQNGENGAYDNKSDETKKIQEELRKILDALKAVDKNGDIKDNAKEQIMAQISSGLLKDPENFNLEEILRKAVGNNVQGQDFEKLKDVAQSYADHTSDGYVYNQIKNADSMGVSMDDFVDKIAENIEYSEGKSTDTQPENSEQKNSPEENSTKVNANNVVEYIQKNEDVETIINTIDTNDMNEFIQIHKRLQDRISELQSINIEQRSEQMRKELSRLESVRDHLEQSMSEE